MRLGNLADVRSGLVLSRKKSSRKTPYIYKQMNLRSIKDDGEIDVDSLDEYHAIEKLNADYITHVGDIIVRLSAPYTAVLIGAENQGLVVSSNFAIIRVDEKKMSAAYLYWLLNTPKVRRQIYENTSSNMLAAINPKFFADFELIPLPYAKQQIIGELNLLRCRENKLLKQLADERSKYAAFLINRAQIEMRREMNV